MTDIQNQENKVDVLVCNAGGIIDERTETSDGIETTFASHFLGGSYLLSQLLLPQLKAASSQARVIFVSSGGMYNGKFPDWATATSSEGAKHKYDRQLAYVYAKRGQVLLAEQLSKDVPEITWVSAHPGWALSPGVEATYGNDKKYLEPLRTLWEGAEGIAWLMAVDREKLEPGAFYLDREPQRKHLAGAFFSEGTFTKNTQEEVDEMMKNLKQATGL